jgi:hypothetical protein
MQEANASVALCSLCNVEMSQARTQFKIDGWKGPQPKLSGEALSVNVYLCPVCGKIEFKADS